MSVITIDFYKDCSIVTKFDDEMGTQELILLHHVLILHKHFIVALSKRSAKKHQGEAPMRQLTIVAATIAIAALISAAPASAEMIAGGPMKQNGKCWKNHGGVDYRFGTWIECPKPAAAPAAQRTTRRRI